MTQALGVLEGVMGGLEAMHAAAAQGRVRELMQRTGRRDTIAGVRKEMMDTMERHAGIYRSGEGLSAACATLADLRRRHRGIELHDKTNVYNTDLLQALELGSMLDCAEAVVQSALARQESRGAHQRLDFTARDDEKFLRHSLAHYQAAEAPRVEYAEVVITRSKPGVRDYSGGHE
jgi:fumarate reductase flavoprotein subunit